MIGENGRRKTGRQKSHFDAYSVLRPEAWRASKEGKCLADIAPVAQSVVIAEFAEAA
jgi:hypothetical protein